MKKMIGSTYEIIDRIGSGGGGNVFLANHLRLNKKVVLKEDKRKLTTKADLLRREVDVLKNLSFTYIPQVYDFFIDGDSTYTVMEYIDGESLDNALKRGERFSQKQVIFWAVELLQALAYLHNPVHGDPPKGFVHSDIKPANIMRRPNNDVCLIDFNIALALGEENVVGSTAGYASPEHYGLDFSTYSNTDTLQSSTETIGDQTETVTVPETGSALSPKKTIRPDVRSDIYSLGATLYHLLSGRRPAKNALEVVSLSKKEFSPQLVDIITKSMNPNPDLRYQSADEMLDAFLHLHENDRRTIRQKRILISGSSILLALLLMGTGTAFTGLKRMQAAEENLKLAEYSENAFAKGDTVKAVALALDAIPQKSGLFEPKVSAEAQKALTDALGVYDLSDGFKAYKTLTLPSEPFDMVSAPDGSTFSCIYAYKLAVFDADSLEILYEKPVTESALAEIKYISDSLIAYAGASGLEVYDLNSKQVLWTGQPATKIAVSKDASTIAAIYKDETSASIYDAYSGEVRTVIDFEGRHQSVVSNDIFANPRDNLLALNEDGSQMAASFADGSLQIFNLMNREEDIVLMEDGSGYVHFEGGYYKEFLAFSADGPNDSVFAVIDTKKAEQTGGFNGQSRFGVKTDNNGIYLSYENVLVKIHPVSGEQTALVTTSQNVNEFAVSDRFTLISNENRYVYFDQTARKLKEKETEISSDFLLLNEKMSVIGSMSSPVLTIEKYADHTQNGLISYSPEYAHDEARISHDWNTVMLFSYKEFYILDSSGNLIKKFELPNPESVYDQQYMRTETSSSLEVTYTDETVLIYDGKNGEQIGSEKRDPPDLSLHEEFYTDHLRFDDDLHGVTKVIDQNTNQQVRELAEDAFLTYVTQIGDSIVVQYVTADGYKYGKLLDRNCNVTAVLPYLSDIYEEQFIFDYPDGSIRNCDVLTLDELIEIGMGIVEGED